MNKIESKDKRKRKKNQDTKENNNSDTLKENVESAKFSGNIESDANELKLLNKAKEIFEEEKGKNENELFDNTLGEDYDDTLNISTFLLDSFDQNSIQNSSEKIKDKAKLEKSFIEKLNDELESKINIKPTEKKNDINNKIDYMSSKHVNLSISSNIEKISKDIENTVKSNKNLESNLNTSISDEDLFLNNNLKEFELSDKFKKDFFESVLLESKNNFKDNSIPNIDVSILSFIRFMIRNCLTI